ncbi:MAG: hypothetical protein WA913_11205, partial [Pricia sp.]
MSSVRIIDYAASSHVPVKSRTDAVPQTNEGQIVDDTARSGNGAWSESVFYSPKWISVLQQMYGFPIYTAMDESQNLKLHLALVDNIAGKKLVSLPFSDYTDIDDDRSADYRDLVEALKAKFPETPIIFKTVGKNEKDQDDAVFGRVTRNALYHRIPTGPTGPTETREQNKTELEGGLDSEVEIKAHKEARANADVRSVVKNDLKATVKNLQSSSFRRNVRKAKKTGTTVAIKRDKTALKNFYTMYHGLRLNKFGSIPQPFSFFETIFKEFVGKGEGFLLEASHENKPIASIMVLQHK